MHQECERRNAASAAINRKGWHRTHRPEPGKTRCRTQDSTPESGERPGNENVLEHVYYSKEAITRRREAKRLLVESSNVLNRLNHRRRRNYV